MTQEQLKLGKACYDGYCSSREWKSVGGANLPEFEKQDKRLQESWCTAAEQVALLHSQNVERPNLTLKLEIVTSKQCKRGIEDQLRFLNEQVQSRERDIAMTKLHEASMWLSVDIDRLESQLL
jgi:hypothetical protein